MEVHAGPSRGETRRNRIQESVRIRRDRILASWDALPEGTVEAIPKGSTRRAVIPRIFDILVAGTALLVFAPVIAAIAIIIRRGTPGPVLFRQKRLGINGTQFTFVKFRTLYADARERFPEMYAYRFTDEDFKKLVFKAPDDPRITPQGRWLRATSLDELPNLWNVLRGDMAMVGPRPDLPQMLRYNRGEMLRRFSVYPGMTGLAHVSGRSHLTVIESVAYDIEYVERRSFWFDLEIMVRTVLAVVLHRGAF